MQYLVKIEAVEPRVVEAEVPAENEAEAKEEALFWLERTHPELQEPVIIDVQELP